MQQNIETADLIRFVTKDLATGFINTKIVPAALLVFARMPLKPSDIAVSTEARVALDIKITLGRGFHIPNPTI